MPGFERVLPETLHDAHEGAVYEWRDDQIVMELARRLARGGGAAIIIDYGHTESAAGETLQAVRSHRYSDPLAEPGLADITAHVDFAALARAASSVGAHVVGPVTQSAFLHRLGIVERANALKANATKLQVADINAALLRLTGGNEMGELFKVLAVADPKLAAVPGFDG